MCRFLDDGPHAFCEFSSNIAILRTCPCGVRHIFGLVFYTKLYDLNPFVSSTADSENQLQFLVHLWFKCCRESTPQHCMFVCAYVAYKNLTVILLLMYSTLFEITLVGVTSN